jgi:phage baseplate assembly protein W
MPVSASYPLSGTGSAITGSTSGTGQGFKIVDSPDILGFGLLAPFVRGPSDFENAGGIDHLQSMIGQVLGTMSGSDYTEGELPWRTEFGSLLHLIRHKQNDEILEELARVYVGQALAKWIPQIRLKDIKTTKKTGPEGEENILEIRITYRLVNINQNGNEILGRSISNTFNFPA